MDQISDRYSAAVVHKLSMISIIGNLFLSAFKLFAGIFGRSGAMISDAVHSLSDVLATFIAWLGVRVSRKEADASHPYGHERFECVASLVLSVILAVTGVEIGKAGLEKILSGQASALEIPRAIALVAAVVSILCKEAMYRYTIHYARKIHSPAFEADAWHHRSDALSSIGSLIGIGGAMLGLPILDPIASVIICLFIFKVAYDIMKDALDRMLDTSGGDEYEQKLMDFIARQPDVLGVDVLHSRLFGSKVYVDLEIEVDGSLTLREAHDVAEAVHSAVEQEFPEIKHIMIHVNPA